MIVAEPTKDVPTPVEECHKQRVNELNKAIAEFDTEVDKKMRFIVGYNATYSAKLQRMHALRDLLCRAEDDISNHIAMQRDRMLKQENIIDFKRYAMDEAEQHLNMFYTMNQ